MKTAEKKIKIFVGQPRPSEAQLGYLEKGNSIIKGVSETCNAIGGFQIIPNRSVVWGIRLDKSGNRPKERLQANDKAYTGKVEWCKWATDGGMPITIRYKSGAPSIDYDYQLLQLGMKPFDQDLEDNYLQFPFGENTIFDSEEMKQQFILCTHENTDSICKDPNVTGGNLRIVKSLESSKMIVKDIDSAFEAGKIVRAADTFERLTAIKMIVSDKIQITYDESDETSLFENLLIYANNNGKAFMDSVNQYTARVSDVIEKFRAYKAFDWTTDGVLKGGQNKQEILLQGIDAKGEDMVTAMFDQRMEPEVVDAINRMTVIAQNFK